AKCETGAKVPIDVQGALIMRIRQWKAAAAAAVVLISGVAATAQRAMADTITAVQRYSFDAPDSSASQLSGITFFGGKRFGAVGDQGQLLHRLKIDVDKG